MNKVDFPLDYLRCFNILPVPVQGAFVNCCLKTNT